jgi:hypothetical protein
VPDWAADRHSPIQEIRCAGVGNTDMFSPISAMITMASHRLRPGISASRCAAASTGEPGLVPAAGPVSPSGSTPQDCGTWASAAIAWVCMPVICWSRNATWSSSIRAITPW